MAKPPLPSRVHCVGIGGIGMSGLASLLLEQGHRVTGSDVRETALTKRLRQQGAIVHIGHAAGHLDGSELVVYSSCIAPHNPELEQARQKGVPVIHRAEALARAVQGRQLIAVTGAHGKTTTTGLIAQMLVEADAHSTFFVGAEVASLNGHAQAGTGRYCVIEADESDGSFLHFHPRTAVVTNVDYEHVDYYHTMEAIKEAFVQFMRQVEPEGTAWVCADDRRLVGLTQDLPATVRTFGFDKAADVSPWQIKRDGLSTHFVARYRGQDIGEFGLKLPGAHNVSNALAAIGVGAALGLPLAAMQEALRKFSGAHRRFQRLELANGVTLIDDYAHHPTEIRATLAAVDRSDARRVIVVFQPHRYSRTHFLREAYLTCFELADTVLVTDIYPAFEPPMADVTSERLVSAMQEAGSRHVSFVPKGEVIDQVRALTQHGDIVMLIGAGDIGDLTHAMATRLSGFSAT